MTFLSLTCSGFLLGVFEALLADVTSSFSYRYVAFHVPVIGSKGKLYSRF